jgi:hypothetical protein
MTNSSRIIVAKSIDEIAKFSELHICTRTMATFWFPYGKIIAIVFFVDCENHVSPFLPHRKLKPYSAYGNPCFSLSCLTENGNPVSPFLRYKEWKPCFSLFCVTENGNPVSPAWLSLTENGNPVSPCFASQKNSKSLFS